MSLQYFTEIYHANTDDSETAVESLISTTEEPKYIKSVILTGTTNTGKLKLYRERDNFAVIPTDGLPLSDGFVIPIDLELPVGEEFSVTLTNTVVGTDAEIIGMIQYEINK